MIGATTAAFAPAAQTLGVARMERRIFLVVNHASQRNNAQSDTAYALRKTVIAHTTHAGEEFAKLFVDSVQGSS